MTGSLVVVGTGPGRAELMTPASSTAVAHATDLVGYGPYLDRIPKTRPDQCRHASDNRVELDRARHALSLAAAGRHVAVVSGGDPGVFAMAAAVFDADVERAPDRIARLDRLEHGSTSASSPA
jgi:precorrin-3B C17-methyltransferase